MTATATTPPAAADKPFPRLREDLRIELVSEDGRALPEVIVADLVRSAYFRLPWPESAILIAWRGCTTRHEVEAKLRQRFGLAPPAEELAAVLEFASVNQLTQGGAGGNWRRLAAQHAARRRNPAMRLLQGYLFFRVPLLRPQALLQRLLPWLAFVYTPAFWWVIATSGLVGLYLATRQWADIAATASDLLRIEVLAVYAVAVLMLKAMHELGHALTTVRYGCRVPSMGIAFMFGAPVFYTDTSDSWRLSSRRARLAIVLAGVAAEMVVAVLAILAWCVLPDGIGRTLCFAVATASIAMTLAINLNPFMRFDGYFALSDHMRVANLQSRAFALGRWWLRERLFDLRQAPPEHHPAPLARFLVVYAVLTAIYRLVLYLGIAAMVYVVAGKAIGIVLAAIEIVMLILRPIGQELAAWWQLRGDIIRRGRSRLLAAAALGLAAILALPWISTVEAPIMLVAAQEEPLHLPFAARLRTIGVRNGETVAAGALLFEADAPDLQRDLEKARLQLATLELQLGRLVASDQEREIRVVLESRWERAQEAAAAIERRLRQLVIRAPFAGRIVDLDPDISTGVWLDGKRPLARLVVPDRTRGRGMLAETDVLRVRVGADAVFIPDDPAAPRERLRVARIAPASDGRFAEPALASRYGGGVIAGEAGHELVARHGMFGVTFDEVPRATPQVMRGIAWIDADRISPLQLAWRQVARLLVREQGF